MLTNQSQDGSTTLSPAARRGLWLAVCLITIGLLSFRLEQMRRQRAVELQWQARVAAVEQASEAARIRLKGLYDQHVLKWTQPDLESALNGGKTLTIKTSSPTEVVTTWRDPASGRPFEFTFRRGNWSGIGTRWGSVMLPAKPGPARSDLIFEGLRARFAGIMVCAWVALFVMLCLLRRYRATVAHVMLPVAVLYTVACAVDMRYSLARMSILSNDSLFWAVGMVLVSAAALWVTLARRRARLSLECPACQYSLIGNVSGVCPECGTPVPHELRARLSTAA
jgi:hypothetical protein